MFKCECGVECKSQGGLTLHKKQCDFKVVVKPSDTPQTSSIPPTPEDGPLATSDRNQIQKLIQRRQDTILRALEDELNGKPEVVMQRLQANHGMILTSKQLEELISTLETQISDEVEKHMGSEKQTIEVQKSEIVDEYFSKEKDLKDKHKTEFQTMKERHTSELTAMCKERDEKIRVVKDKLIKLKETIIKEKAAPLLEQKIKYQQQLSRAKEDELKLENQVKQRMAFVQHSRGRLENIVRDAGARAMEKLWTTNSRKDAVDLIQSIPTVAEVLKMLQTSEGIGDLFKRLNPEFVLPAPVENISQVTIDAAAKECKVESVSDDGDDDPQDAASVIEEHDAEVYEEEETPRRRNW